MPAQPTFIETHASGVRPTSDRAPIGYTLLVSVIAALGGLLFGFDTAVISGTVPFIRPYFGLDETSLGWAVSSVLVGCMIGTLAAGRPSDRFGRKPVLIVTALFFGVSAIGTALATDFTFFVLVRLMGGLAVGTASLLSPVYIAEIAPARLRGTLVSVNQLTITIGILVAFFSNYLLVGLGENNWRWMFGVGFFPSFVFFVLLFLVPESPRWLAKQGRTTEALQVLRRVRGDGADVEAELAEILHVLQGEHKGKFSDLKEPRIRPLLVIAIVLAALQQVTGINTIMYYAPIIFERAGVSTDSAILQTVAVGAVNLLFTFVALYLIDRMGRKPLLLAGSAGMAISLALLAGAFFLNAFQGYAVLVFILAYIASFAASLGPVVWVVNAEIFPTKIRGVAVSLATFVLWLACFVVSLTFPWLLARLDGGFTFLIYAVLCVITFLFVWRRVPETKGKSLERIEEELVGADF